MIPYLLVALFGCKDNSEDTAAPTPEAPWPEWALHHWVWEDESTQDSALALVEGYLSRDIPVGAIIIDSPWATGYSTYEFDSALFPDPQAMIDDLHADGVRVFLWTVPGINTGVYEGHTNELEVALYEQAAAAGYFMQDDADSGPEVVEWWKGDGSLIDYFNPDAVAWWHALMDPILDLGIDGWKTDGLDYSAILAPYSPGAGRDVSRLEYSHAYYQDTFDYTRERLGDDRLITSRPIDNYGIGLGGDNVAFTPVEIAWAAWVGDQDADFGGLTAALNNMYWSADYGYTLFGSDIGGYREDDAPENEGRGRSEEVLIRWAQLGALNPIMENGGGGNHEPWLFSDAATDIYRDFVNLHYDLIPYLMEQGGIAFAEGESLMDFQSDETYTYLLGPDVFVAPFLESGTTIEVIFPDEGEWVYLFDSSSRYTAGEQVTMEVPIEEFPVFLRDGSALVERLAR